MWAKYSTELKSIVEDFAAYLLEGGRHSEDGAACQEKLCTDNFGGHLEYLL